MDRLSKRQNSPCYLGFCLLNDSENLGRIFTSLNVIESKLKMIIVFLKTTRLFKFKIHCMIKLSF